MIEIALGFLCALLGLALWAQGKQLQTLSQRWARLEFRVARMELQIAGDDPLKIDLSGPLSG